MDLLTLALIGGATYVVAKGIKKKSAREALAAQEGVDPERLKFLQDLAVKVQDQINKGKEGLITSHPTWAATTEELAIILRSVVQPETHEVLIQARPNPQGGADYYVTFRPLEY